ncbi:MAG: M23 family metallopeptidase [Bacteroidia bacterium]|nr:M23 family metallopeptidase [Bacteroidia bacterium]MCX7763694.1 M23 family metallopeptidase [Bacteroidia bacterium]MDW8057025.1 M23 family metallopeptidase [Bacteroidia bacterium]
MRRQYRFLPKQLEFRRLPPWHALRLGRLFIFLAGVIVGVWGGAYLLFRWRPSTALQLAKAKQAEEEKQLAALIAHRDSLARLVSMADSMERQIYHQIVPPLPANPDSSKEIASPTPKPPPLSEDTLTKYLAKTEDMLRELVRAEEILQSIELHSARLPRRLPCDCPEMGAGLGEVSHPLTGQPQKHEGIDLLISEGSPVWTTAEGIVQSIEGSRTEGARIIIQHSPILTTVYYPVVPTVEPGQWISAGSLIGKVGRVPLGRIPFLHYEVRLNGKATDPFPFLWGQMDQMERQRKKQALALQVHGLH